MFIYTYIHIYIFKISELKGPAMDFCRKPQNFSTRSSYSRGSSSAPQKYIYIYIYRERERCMSIHIYIYIYIYRERDV